METVNETLASTATIHTNQWGNVIVPTEIPAGCVHIPGKRVCVTAKRIGIPYAPAVVGWRGSRKWRKPLLDGVVIKESDSVVLKAVLAERRILTAEQREVRRDARQQRQTKQFADGIKMAFPSMPEICVEECALHATEIGSGRVGRSIQLDDPYTPAVIAYIRHQHTEYDEYLSLGMERDDARNSVSADISKLVEQWRYEGGNKRGQNEGA